MVTYLIVALFNSSTKQTCTPAFSFLDTLIQPRTSHSSKEAEIYWLMSALQRKNNMYIFVLIQQTTTKITFPIKYFAKSEKTKYTPTLHPISCTSTQENQEELSQKGPSSSCTTTGAVLVLPLVIPVARWLAPLATLQQLIQHPLDSTVVLDY